MPTGKILGYCSCCGVPDIEGEISVHNDECIWDADDEAKYQARKLKEKENNDRL